MINLPEGCKAYLENAGYTSIFMDGMPVQPLDCIAVFEYESGNPFGATGINYGSTTQLMQVRVRRKTLAEARGVAVSLFKLLDSGGDETLFDFGGNSAICRPRGTPYKLDDDGKAVVFSCNYRVQTFSEEE
ncbi:minor capsid protein [Eubacteriales bacterium OttesenSCG-928-K08]|nr:minor capsid protein [Eubacteriales bacterium OttesenSCG-928-K08]